MCLGALTVLRGLSPSACAYGWFVPGMSLFAIFHLVLRTPADYPRPAWRVNISGERMDIGALEVSDRWWLGCGTRVRYGWVERLCCSRRVEG